MAAVFDASIANIATGTAATVSSGNLTLGVLTNACAIAMAVQMRNTSATPAVDHIYLDASALLPFTRFNGITLLNADGTNNTIEIWRLLGVALTSGIHTADVTFTASADGVRYVSFSTYQGVDQTTPLAGFASDNTDTSSPSSISPAGGTASDLLTGMLQNVNGDAATVGISSPGVQLGATKTENTYEGSQYIAGYWAGDAASLGFTWSATVKTATIGAVIKAASGGGATRPVKMAGEWGGYAGESGGFAGKSRIAIPNRKIFLPRMSKGGAEWRI